MASPVSLPQLKDQLRGISGTDEDAHLQRLLDAATRTCVLHIERSLTDPLLTADDLVTVGQAILVLATALYEDREGVGDLPAGVCALLRPLRSWAR